MNTLEAELVVDARAVLGEGPMWDAAAGVVWWTDILGRRLHRFDPVAGADTAVEVGQEVGAVVPRAGGGLLAAVRDGFAEVTGDGSLAMLAEVEADRPDNRMNDGKCDRAGRFWAATMAFDCTPGRGSLYVLEPDRSVRTALTGLTIGNGLAWTPDDRTLYYIDSTTQSVDAFDFDLDKGLLGARRRVIEIEPATEPGATRIPDGMCIDAEGCLWVALHGAGTVCRYRPDGSLDTVVTLPCALVTCPTFGGPDLRDLYVTTATHSLSEAERRRQPGAGGLFRVRTDVPGVAPFAYAG